MLRRLLWTGLYAGLVAGASMAARRAALEDLAGRDGRGAPGEDMTRMDATIDRAARKLNETARKAAARGGLAAKLAAPLADDAAFLRKLKPSLIAARARGEAPTDQAPGEEPLAPQGPQLDRPTGQHGGPNPLLYVGGALAAGILIAKLVDWRSHAHPRD